MTTYRTKRAATAVIALSLGLGLAACGTTDKPQNMSLYSVKQPVVERNSYTLDLVTSAGGLTVPEQGRLADWFEVMGVGYGDRISIDDPAASPAVMEDVAAVASRYGLLVGNDAPVTDGYVNPGNVRVVVTRSTAYVPGCPDWSDRNGWSRDNETSDGFGCAVNANIAAMVADPEHLLEGASGTGETVVMTSNRAIDSYRNASPTGNGGTTLPEVSSEGN